MKNSKHSHNLVGILLLVILIITSNGCGIIEGNGEWTMGYEFFERSVFDSIGGIYK